MVPPQAPLGPAGVGLDEVPQRIAGFAGLADRLDGLDVPAPALLPPLVAVVPDLAALDLDADDAGALDGDDEVDLVVLEVVGHALAGDDEIVVLELLSEELPDLALSVVGKAGVDGESDRHSTRVARGTVIGEPKLVGGLTYPKGASGDTIAKLRLDGAPTPRSRVARMTKRLAQDLCRQERRLRGEGLDEEEV